MNDKKQVSITIDLIEQAKHHPLYTKGKGEGQGVAGLVNFALSWALDIRQQSDLRGHQASFELANLQAEKEALEARIAALTPAPSPEPKKGKVKK